MSMCKLDQGEMGWYNPIYLNNLINQIIITWCLEYAQKNVFRISRIPG